MRNYFHSLTARNADALSSKGSRRQVSLLKRKQMSPTLSNSFQRRTKVSQSSEFGHSSCKIARSFTACEVTVRILYYFPFCDFNVVLSEKCLENKYKKQPFPIFVAFPTNCIYFFKTTKHVTQQTNPSGFSRENSCRLDQSKKVMRFLKL